MLAYLDSQLRHQSTSAATSGPTSATSDDEISSTYGSDFGGIVRTRPASVVRPASAADVAAAVTLALRNPPLTVAPRGNGHSVAGQSQSDAGVVLDMRSLSAAAPFQSVVANGAIYADVSGGALWSELLAWSVAAHRAAPATWTDYLDLTVGGTLSNAGVSGQAFRRGPQISAVSELEVVDGHGRRRVCSPDADPDLFFAVLGGLGQFGVISRARIPLLPAPDMVKWMRVVYGRFEEYSADAELLVSRTGSDAFDYVEGFAFVNRDDPVNGYGSVALGPDTGFDSSRVPPGSGPVLYCLEVALHFRKGENVDKRAEEMMRGGCGRQRAVASMLPYLAKTLRSKSPKISNLTLLSLRYTDTGFTINRVNYDGSLLIVENKIMSWSPKRFSEITTESLSIFQVLRAVPEILILGCGRNIKPINPEPRHFIPSTGMKLEAVD